MLISPPFLPAQGANEHDEAYVTRCMAGDQPGDGAFPVSLQLGWHGGLHLTAPQDGSDAERVRAIADGKVIFRRDRTVVTTQPASDHPLYYDHGYTSDGCVVIQHDTEIGATAAGQATALRFYSIYLHLQTIDTGVRLNQAIYRKDVIGQAGNIAGQPNRIHFEIVGDDASFRPCSGDCQAPRWAIAAERMRSSAAFISACRPVPRSMRRIRRPRRANLRCKQATPRIPSQGRSTHGSSNSNS
jgi:hypothetical protein